VKKGVRMKEEERERASARTRASKRRKNVGLRPESHYQACEHEQISQTYLYHQVCVSVEFVIFRVIEFVTCR